MTRRHDHTRAAGMGRAWDAGEPRRQPPIKILSVVCPTCEAQPQQSCINQGLRTGPQDKGKPCSPHPSRKRMAIRAYNAQREKEAQQCPPS